MRKTLRPAADPVRRTLRNALAGAAAVLITILAQPAPAQTPGHDTPAAASAQPAPPAAEQLPAGGSDAPSRTVPSKPSFSISLSPHDLSPWAMFLGADRVVKFVITLLVLASTLTWTVWLSKSLELRQARRKLTASMPGLDEAASLADVTVRADPVIGAMLTAARKELAHFPLPYGNVVATGIKERIAARLDRIEAAAGKRMRRGTTALASIGATAPFVGLFGTVWGIMNSFVGISQAHATNLAVVAPGIAEALLATALGLVAAIPAVLIYNTCIRAVAGYKVLVADASTLVMCVVSRDMDRHALEGRESGRVEVEHRRPVAVK